jgi:hypothetical protein
MIEEDNPFESPRLLIDGARRHIASFEAKLDDLGKDGFWADPVSPDTGVQVRAGFKAPPEMKQIVFDLTQNLRSALDHAVYASTFMLTGYDGEGGTKFPFGDTAKNAKDDAKKKCRRVPHEIVTFLLAFEPHSEGNPVLYGLNKLRNTKSHRVLLPISVASRKTITATIATAATLFLPSDDAADQALQPFHVPAGAEANFFRLEILIGTGTFKGEPALGVFNRMLSEVERVVSAVEAETSRLTQ